MTEWKAMAVTYGNDVADTAARLERRLNTMMEEGYALHDIFHSVPHFIVVAKRENKKRSNGVSKVQAKRRPRPQHEAARPR